MFGLGIGKSSFGMDQLAVLAAVAFVVYQLSRSNGKPAPATSHWIRRLSDDADVRAAAILTERYGRKKADEFVSAMTEAPSSAASSSASSTSAAPLKLKPIGEAMVP